MVSPVVDDVDLMGNDDPSKVGNQGTEDLPRESPLFWTFGRPKRVNDDIRRQPMQINSLTVLEVNVTLESRPVQMRYKLP